MDPRLKILMDLYPDYQSFTASDFRRLSDSALRTVIGAFAHKLTPQVLVPQSFVRQYGDDAAGQVMLAAQREALRRGKPEIFATATLNGGLGGEADKITGGDSRVNSEVVASVTLADNTVRRSTAPKILNYQVAQDAIALIAKNEAARQRGTYTPQTYFNVVVPQSAIAAVVAANNLPQQLAAQGFDFVAHDEIAFMSGYATRAGASREIGHIHLDYPSTMLCNLDKGVSRIANSERPDIDAGLAWSLGYAQRDLDEMPAQQRTVISANCQKAKAVSR
ncbi:MAG: hypothetical protein ACK5VT_08050 [Alphaproteobacteria bacterium]|jgi:hypothetical protein